MRGKPQFRNMQRMLLDEAFKQEEHPFRIAIVCAMWLTGFDVPSLSTLYLDKPLKAHTLMQAIARANRVNEGKNNGLIVDYSGILRHLRQALATFAGAEGAGEDAGTDPARPDEELLADLAEAIALVSFGRNAAIVASKEAANENDQTRKRFEVMCREVESGATSPCNASSLWLSDQPAWLEDLPEVAKEVTERVQVAEFTKPESLSFQPRVRACSLRGFCNVR